MEGLMDKYSIQKTLRYVRRPAIGVSRRTSQSIKPTWLSHHGAGHLTHITYSLTFSGISTIRRIEHLTANHLPYIPRTTSTPLPAATTHLPPSRSLPPPTAAQLLHILDVLLVSTEDLCLSTMCSQPSTKAPVCSKTRA